MADINKDDVLRSLTAAIQVQTLKIADEPRKKQVRERVFDFICLKNFSRFSLDLDHLRPGAD